MEKVKEFREELLNSVDTLTDEQLNTRISEDSWTIGQVLEHLYLMETVIIEAMTAALNGPEVVGAEDKPIELAVNRSVKVKAPDSVTPSEDNKTLHELLQKLAFSRQELLDFVNSADPEELKRRSCPHPVFGRLSLSQWIPFIGYHEKRHLEQIEEIKVKLIN